MFYELRQYKVLAGKMDEWVPYMEETIIPFQARGMVVTGSFQGEAYDSVYIWLRRFESEAERERLYAAVYDTDEWKNEMAPRVGELIDRESISVQRIVPTPRSVAQ